MIVGGFDRRSFDSGQFIPLHVEDIEVLDTSSQNSQCPAVNPVPSTEPIVAGLTFNEKPLVCTQNGACLAHDKATNTWETVVESLGMDLPVLTLFNDELLVSSGDVGFNKQIYRLDVDSGELSDFEAKLPPEINFDFELVQLDETHLLLISLFGRFDELYTYELGSGVWESMPFPPGVSGVSTATVKGVATRSNGQQDIVLSLAVENDSPFPNPTRATWVFHDGVWTSGEDFPGNVNSHLGSVQQGSTFLVPGGVYGTYNYVFSRDIYRYLPDQQSWEKLPVQMESGRVSLLGAGAAFVVPDHYC